MTDWQLNPIFDSPLAVALVVVLLAGLLGVTLWLRRVSRRRGWVLTGFRAAAISILILLMLQPTSILVEVQKQSATLVVLVDVSRSLLVPDESDGRTRWQVLRRILEEHQKDFAQLGDDLEVKFYTFAEAAQSVTAVEGMPQLPESPPGEETALGAVLDDVLRLEAHKRLVGILLLSDGVQQSYSRTLAPHDAVLRMSNLIPLYTVSVGGAAVGPANRDAAVRNLLAGPVVYVKNELEVRAEVEVTTFPNEDVLVELLFGREGQMEVVERTQIRTASGAQTRVPIELRHVPQSAGEYKVTLRAATLPGELITTNNEQSTYVTVLEGGLNVLYLEGDVRVEQRFVRSALGASPDINVDYVQLDHRRLNSPDRERMLADLAERFQPGKYDVYLLGDLSSLVFKQGSSGTPAQDYPALEQLRRTVGQGAGLMMIGGLHSFNVGGYHRTPLADLLPIRGPDRLAFDLEVQNPAERQTGDPPRDLHWLEPLRMRPAEPAGINHPVLRLAGGGPENLQAWSRLPPLDGANRFHSDRIKPAAQVLAVAAEQGEQAPLLLSMEVGGRILAFAGDSTWRWSMQGQRAAHQRFWRQAIFWLARQDARQGDVWVKLDAHRTEPNRPLRFTAGARNADGEPILDAALNAQLELPDGTTAPLRLVRQEEFHSGSILETQQSGDYTVVVTASRDGRDLGIARARFIVDDYDLELDNAAANPSLLESLAAATSGAGGRAVLPEELPALLAELKEKPKELDIHVPYRRVLGGQPLDASVLLLLFVGLMAAEWFLRKRWGLA